MQDMTDIAKKKLTEYLYPTDYNFQNQLVEDKVTDHVCKQYHASIYLALHIFITIFVILLASCLIGIFTKTTGLVYFIWQIGAIISVIMLPVLFILHYFINRTLKAITRDHIEHLFKK